MPRYGLATLNHSTMHGLPTQWEAHLDAAASAGFEAIAPDVFWLRKLEEESVALATLRAGLESRELACMEIAGIAIGAAAATQAELDEWAERPVAFQVVIVQPYVLAKPISAVIS